MSKKSLAFRLTWLSLFVVAIVAGYFGVLGHLSQSATATVYNPTPPSWYVRTLRSKGLVCDGATDDSAAFSAAIANGNVALDGQGLTCGVSGSFTLRSNTWLHNFTLKQLTPAAGSVRTLTTPGGSTVSNIVLDKVAVNRNGLPTQGVVGNDAGIYLSNITDSVLRNVEVYGDGRGYGIFLSGNTGSCDNVAVENAYVHDIRWSAASDPGSEQATGLWFSTCTNSTAKNPVVKNILSNIASAGYTAYQTDCLDISNSANIKVLGGTLSFCGEGSDVSGSGTNKYVWFFGTDYQDIGSFGQKWVHDVSYSGSVGSHCERCGLGGLVFGNGTLGVDAEGPTHMIAYGFVARDTGSSGVWAGGNVAGVASLDGGDPSINPSDVVCDQCETISTTQKYGFRNEPGTAASLKLVFPRTSGATTSDYVGVTNIVAQNSTGGLTVGSPTGGDKGAGTANVPTFYENGTSLASKYATLAAPALTGVPTAPTAAVDTNTTQIATTAYVIGQSYLKLSGGSLTGTLNTSAIFNSDSGGFVVRPSGSYSSWGASGKGLIMGGKTWTDTSASGTLAAEYLNLFQAPTFAFSNPTTVTNAYNTFFERPGGGTNGTLTNRWGVGTDSLKVTGQSVNMSGLTTGTNADTLCMDANGNLLIQAAACTISSKRFKNVIGNYDGDAFAALARMPVVEFVLKDAAKNPDRNAALPQLGLLAEDVARAEPRCALYERDMRTPKSYRQECLIAMLVNLAVRDHREIEALKRRARR